MKEMIRKSKIIRKLAKMRGSVRHDSGKCVYCGACAGTCQMKAIEVRRKERELTIDHDLCVRCGCCVKKMSGVGLEDSKIK